MGIAKDIKKFLSVVFGFALVTASSRNLYGYKSQVSTPPADTGNPTEPTPMSASQLQAMVAPIALYPDALVAQILGAATFPDQVAISDYWLEENKNLTGSAQLQAVDKQSWDPSVKALTEFPSVLDNLAKNLSWTSSLGEAYHNQQADVMAAVQTLRAQAKANGNLKSTPQVTVVQQSPQVIVIQPANPQVVYIPQYNPAVIYATPYVTPGYSAGDAVAAGVIGFGAGIATGTPVQWCITAVPSTAILPGTAGITTAATTTATATTMPTTTRMSRTTTEAAATAITGTRAETQSTSTNRMVRTSAPIVPRPRTPGHN